MPFYFRPFPLVEYDVKKNGKPVLLTNLVTGYKLLEAFQRQEAIYYSYDVKDGERPDTIAFKYYGDATLDWVILITNNIIDPDFDWPLSTVDLRKYITKKYGSVATATEQIHHYEQILNEPQTLFDGTFIPARYEQVDLTTYNSLDSADRRIVTSYEYEVKLNEDKRSIQILSKEFIPTLLAQVKQVFK